MWEEQAAWPELLLWGETAIAPGKKKEHLQSIDLKCGTRHCSYCKIPGNCGRSLYFTLLIFFV